MAKSEDVSSWGTTARRVGRLLAWLCMALGTLVLVVTVTPLTKWCARCLAGPMNVHPSGDVLIVLGGSVLDDGTVGGSSYWRSVYAARAWKVCHFQRVLISGGNDRGVPVAEAMRDFLISQGVPRDVVVIEARSLTTRQNALDSRALLSSLPLPARPAGAVTRIVLLTSDYHMYRARRVFSRAGINTEPWPVPDVWKLSLTWEGRWSAFLTLVREAGGIAYYWLRGWC
jgi:uncharacterized SAM-binding protein YcdF (DUF218 family)